MRQKWQIATLPIHRYVAVSWASQAFGLPSTIRTCDLRLRRAQAYFLQASLYGRQRTIGGKEKPPRRMALLIIFITRLLNSFINYFLAVFKPSRLYAGQLPIIPVTSGMMPIQPQAPTIPYPARPIKVTPTVMRSTRSVCPILHFI